MIKNDSITLARRLRIPALATGMLALAAGTVTAADTPIHPDANIFGFNGSQNNYDTETHHGWYKFGPNGEENHLWADYHLGAMGTYFNVGYIRNGKLCGYHGNQSQLLYLEFNLETGTLLLDRDIPVKSEEYAHRNMLSGAYNPADDCVYGFASNIDSTRAYFVKASAADPENVTIVREIPQGYAILVSCCFSPVDNHMYGIDALGDLVRVDVYGNFELVKLMADMDYMGGDLAGWESGMTYSPKDNAFIWSRQLPIFQSHLVKIDIDNDYQWTKVSDHGDQYQFTILACTDTDGDDNGPVAPTIVSQQIDHANMSGTIEYKMPVKLADGSDAPASMNWSATCGMHFQNGTAAPGETVTVTYTGLENGEQNFTFRALAGQARGASVVTNRWVGLDKPQPPTNVTLTPVTPGNYKLSWTAPAQAAHNGYMDASKLMYAIFLDGKQVGAPITACEADVTLPTDEDTREYFFEVVALADGMVSESMKSNKVYTGRGFGIPYTIVPTDEDAEKMTSINVDNDKSRWGFVSEIGDGYAFYTNRDWDNAGDDYLITPPLWFDDTSKKYNIEFEVRYHNPNKVEEYFDVWLGTGDNADDIREKRIAPKTKVNARNYYKVNYDFEVATPGTYYLGIHYTGDADQGGIYARKIKITQTDKPSSAAEIGADGVSVKGADGAIIVSGIAGMAEIYATDGRLVASARVNGETSVSVASGVYVVRMAGKAYKVHVK